MDAVEQEIIEKFHRLEPDAQQRVLQTLSVQATNSFNYDEWRTEVEQLQADIRSRMGETATIGTLSLLDELREESS
jgi:hypothetical protein